MEFEILNYFERYLFYTGATGFLKLEQEFVNGYCFVDLWEALVIGEYHASDGLVVVGFGEFEIE